MGQGGPSWLECFDRMEIGTWRLCIISTINFEVVWLMCLAIVSNAKYLKPASVKTRFMAMPCWSSMRPGNGIIQLIYCKHEENLQLALAMCLHSPPSTLWPTEAFKQSPRPWKEKICQEGTTLPKRGGAESSKAGCTAP